MNVVSKENQPTVIGALAEGNSIRAIERYDGRGFNCKASRSERLVGLRTL